MPRREASASADVREHLEEILDLAEAHSVNRGRIDWPSFRAEIWNAARRATTLVEAEPAILRVLELLNDGHSLYRPASPDHGRNQSPSRPPLYSFVQCPQVSYPSPAIPENIGYVRVPGSAQLPQQDAEEIQQQIRDADRGELLGWIVDLRGNTGGNMWGMLLGVGSVLGEGVAGYFVEPDGTRRAWGYADGAAVADGAPALKTEASYTLRRPATRIAVLTDAATVSSGEAIVVAFRGRAGARSFGQPTCGRSSVNRTFQLRNGASLNLTVGLMADREGKVYGSRIEPDVLTNGTEAIQRAMDWLTSPVAR